MLHQSWRKLPTAVTYTRINSFLLPFLPHTSQSTTEKIRAALRSGSCSSRPSQWHGSPPPPTPIGGTVPRPAHGVRPAPLCTRRTSFSHFALTSPRWPRPGHGYSLPRTRQADRRRMKIGKSFFKSINKWTYPKGKFGHFNQNALAWWMWSYCVTQMVP